jgi:membrane protein
MDSKTIFGLLKDTWDEWNTDRAPRLGASLAFYTVLSLSPLLIVAIAIAGFFFGQQAAQGELFNQATKLIGPQGADALQSLVQNANKPGAGLVATILSAATLLLGASGVFGELQGAMNIIWGVEERPGQGVVGMIKNRFLSFGFVLGAGFLLLVSLILSTVLNVLSSRLQSALPGADMLWQILEFAVSFAIITLLFAAIFKFIPDVEISWGDVAIGAVVTSLLFAIGRLLLGLYLGNSGTTSVYGAAGSLVAVVLWVYYSAQILFFGAEFTQVYASRYGSAIRPSAHAIAVGKWDAAAAAQRAVTQERQVPAPAQPTAAGQPAPAQPTAAGQPAPAQRPPMLRTLVPFSFVIGLLLGAYRRVKSR